MTDTVDNSITLADLDSDAAILDRIWNELGLAQGYIKTKKTEKHLAGKHDQKTHAGGRGRSVSEIETEIAALKKETYARMKEGKKTGSYAGISALRKKAKALDAELAEAKVSGGGAAIADEPEVVEAPKSGFGDTLLKQFTNRTYPGDTPNLTSEDRKKLALSPDFDDFAARITGLRTGLDTGKTYDSTPLDERNAIFVLSKEVARIKAERAAGMYGPIAGARTSTPTTDDDSWRDPVSPAALRAVGAVKPPIAKVAPKRADYEGPLQTETEYRAVEHLKRTEDYADYTMARIAEERGYDSVDEAEEAFISDVKRMLKDSDVAMRVPSDVLVKILGEGFKNQHETGTSRGLLDNGYRAEAEKMMFGIPYGSSPRAYPVYGIVNVKGRKGGNAAEYGDALITFKDEVKRRTTFTSEDSLDEGAEGTTIPAPWNQPRLAAVSVITFRSGLSQKGTKSSPGTLSNSSGTYWEAQIHGELTDRDIAKVGFSSKPPQYIITELEERGIPWEEL